MTSAQAELPDRLRPALALFFRHASPRVLSALALAAVGVRAAQGGFSAGDVAVAAGILVAWPLQEWLIHVFILHYEPRTLFGRRLDFKVPILHRAHHRDPWRVDLVFVPIHVFLYVPLVLAIVIALGLPAPELVWSGIAVYFALSLHYEWVHFMIHTRYRPRLGYYQKLARNHLLHHFRNERFWYGVTMLQADRLLRTAPDPRGVATSPTCRSISAPAGS
jgi:hypothetical protein